MTLEKGWLGRQFNHVSNDVQRWPDWMRREAGIGEFRPASQHHDNDSASAERQPERARAAGQQQSHEGGED